MTLIGWGGNSTVHLINGKIEKHFKAKVKLEIMCLNGNY